MWAFKRKKKKYETRHYGILEVETNSVHRYYIYPDYKKFKTEISQKTEIRDQFNKSLELVNKTKTDFVNFNDDEYTKIDKIVSMKLSWWTYRIEINEE